MIRYQMKSGKQTITEICEDCKCHVRNLSISDIIVKKTDLILKDEDGNEITRTEPRAKCYCENCDHGS